VNGNRRPQSGYSLIEVLVAFAILAMALTVLLRVFSGGLRNVDAAAGYAEAVAIADTMLASPGVVEPLVPGVIDGEGDGGYAWTRTIEALETNDGDLVTPYRIAVSVEWRAGVAERRVEFATVRLGTNGGSSR